MSKDELAAILDLTLAVRQLTREFEQLSIDCHRIANALEKPSPGWRRALDEFKGAVSRIPTSIRTRF
jgi:hypothetical protein